MPRSIGGDDIVAITAKVTWLPWEVALPRELRVRPITVGLQVTYTLGDQYHVVIPEHYPDEYYDFPTALHGAITLGGTLARHRDRGLAREVGVYWELVALDTMLRLWATNRDALGPQDVFSLALGIRVAL